MNLSSNFGNKIAFFLPDMFIVDLKPYVLIVKLSEIFKTKQNWEI
jgi:hypothetical protein